MSFIRCLGYSSQTQSMGCARQYRGDRRSGAIEILRCWPLERDLRSYSAAMKVLGNPGRHSRRPSPAEGLLFDERRPPQNRPLVVTEISVWIGIVSIRHQCPMVTRWQPLITSGRMEQSERMPEFVRKSSDNAFGSPVVRADVAVHFGPGHLQQLQVLAREHGKPVTSSTEFVGLSTVSQFRCVDIEHPREP